MIGRSIFEGGSINFMEIDGFCKRLTEEELERVKRLQKRMER